MSAHTNPLMNTRSNPRRRALAVLAMILVVLAGLASGLTRLRKEPSVDALVPPSSHALKLRATVRKTFGLKDPIVVALATDRPDGILDRSALQAVHQLTAALRGIPQIDPDQVFSLSTEQWVRADGDALDLEPLLPPEPLPADVAQAVKRALAATPMYRGVLVATDFSAALIAAELRDGADAADAYEAVLARVQPLRLPAGLEVQVAGEATSAGFLSRFIDRDTYVVTPAAAVLMLVFLSVFLRGWRGMAAGAFVMSGTLAATVGAMGWLGSPLYIVTSCLPAILLCVSIADASHYGARIARLRSSGVEASVAIVEAMRELWRPILLTSFTNAAGFAAMALTSNLPPLVDYGAFAAFGVAVAWVLTAFGVPALFHLIGAPDGRAEPARAPRFEQPVRRIAGLLADHPRLVLVATGLLVAVGIASTLSVEYNEDRIRNFGTDSAVYRANQLINERFAGSNFLDVYLRVEAGHSLLEPEIVARIENLQAWMEHEGGFARSFSFVDLLKMIAAAAQAGAALPASAEEAEQYLFLFEVSGEPGALRQEITPDRTQAYLRGHLRTGNYQLNKPRIEALRAQLQARFAGTGVVAEATGAVNVTDAMVGPYLPSTMAGIFAAALLTSLMCALMLRSWRDGLLCLLPVAAAVLCVFGLMGALGIWLSMATSMFASIGIGLGVDFAIHTLHAVRLGQAQGHVGPALTRFVHRDVGAPLTANMLILVLGFSVTTLSSIPPLRSFGLLVSGTVIGSYLAAVLILPSIYAIVTRRSPARIPQNAVPEVPS